MLRCSSENLPFLAGKYIYWLGVLCVVVFGVALKKNCKSLKINSFDAIILVLAVFGRVHFMLISKSTIYNSDIWNYIGYVVLYFILRNQCSAGETTIKTLSALLYFCCGSALLNVVLMFLQWKHLMASPNQFFTSTGMFFSPNQLGVFLSIGCLSTLFLWRKATVFWLKIGLGLCALLIFLGLCVSASRGAFISLFVAIGYFLIVSKVKTKPFSKWIMYLGIGVLLAGSFYFIGIISKNKSESTSGRFFTTQQVLKQIAEQPLGYGLNSFSLEYNKAKASYFEKNSNWGEMKNAGYIYKANNDLLELTFELGIFWMALFLFLIMMLFWKKSDGIETQIGRAILICLLLFSFTTSIITLPVLMIIASICTIVIVNTTQPKVVYELKNHFIFRFLVMGMMVSFAGVLITRITAEYKLFRLYEDKMYLKSESQLQGYVSKINNAGEEFFMGGLTLIKNGYVNEGFQYLQIGFERSGKPSLGRVLANGLKQQKKYAQAEKIYRYNKNVEPYRYEARMDLFNLYIETKQGTKAKAMAQEIMQLPVKIPSPLIVGYKKQAKAYLSESFVKQKKPL